METVTIKMERKHVALLKAQAKVLGRSRAAVVRDLIDQHLAQKKRPSLHDLARDLCGSILRPGGYVHAETNGLWPRLKYCSMPAR